MAKTAHPFLMAAALAVAVMLLMPATGTAYPADIGPSTLETPMDYIGDLPVPTNHLGEPTLSSRVKVQSANEFMEALKQILQSDETKTLIQTLIAQITEPALRQP